MPAKVPIPLESIRSFCDWVSGHDLTDPTVSELDDSILETVGHKLDSVDTVSK